MGKYLDQLRSEFSETPTPATAKTAKFEKDSFDSTDGRGFSKITLDPEAPDVARRLWLIRHPDGLASHSFTPEATLTQVRQWYPGALDIVPEVDPSEPLPEPLDDRRTCRECTRLTPGGGCLGAHELPHAMRPHHPDPERLHRCAAYLPGPGDLDRRSGRERWPGQTREVAP